jgi:molybdopterin converting factor small subunit
MKIELSSALRRFANGERVLHIDGNTFFEILDRISVEYPELARNILSSKSELMAFIAIFIDGRNQVDLSKDIPLENNSVIAFVPSIAGG